MSRDSESSDALATPDEPDKVSWHQRPTIRHLLAEMVQAQDYTQPWDDRDNAETRLPESEAVHLGGITLVEAFAPSTVGSLHATLESWPTEFRRETGELLTRLAESRSGAAGGWQTLALVRPPGAFIATNGYHDPELPPGVQGVWLQLSYITPALVMVVATFTLAEDAADLSDVLRQDHHTQNVEPWVQVHGPFGRVRSKIPWARPRLYSSGNATLPPEEQKRRACLSFMRRYEIECGRWFYTRFRGRFALCQPEQRPRIRVLFTEKHVPYDQRFPWLRPIGLDLAIPLWRGTDPAGWWLSEHRHPNDADRHVVTLSARRSDVIDDSPYGSKDASNWYLTQRLGTHYTTLASRGAILALLSLYAGGLAELRDTAGQRRWLRRPVRDGQALDDYLVRDGLDAATVVSDLRRLTNDPVFFRWGMPVFAEQLVAHPRLAPRQARDFAETLREAVRERADRLAIDTAATTENIRASAELRQAIANTRLQRRVLALTCLTAIIAIVGLLLAVSH